MPPLAPPSSVWPHEGVARVVCSVCENLPEVEGETPLCWSCDSVAGFAVCSTLSDLPQSPVLFGGSSQLDEIKVLSACGAWPFPVDLGCPPRPLEPTRPPRPALAPRKSPLLAGDVFGLWAAGGFFSFLRETSQGWTAPSSWKIRYRNAFQ